MNEKQAIAKLKRIIGPKLAWRLDPKAPRSDDERARQREAWRVFKDSVGAANAAMEARRKELLAQDADYQNLRKARDAAQAALDAAPSGHRHPITVGRIECGFFSVRAEGNNWAEVVEKLERSKTGNV